MHFSPVLNFVSAIDSGFARSESWKVILLVFFCFFFVKFDRIASKTVVIFLICSVFSSIRSK